MAKNATSIKRGEIRNPKGRPKLTPEAIEARAYAKQYTKAAIDGLAEIAFNRKSPVSARVTAMIALLDRGHGKPTNPVEVEATTVLREVTFHIAGMKDDDLENGKLMGHE